MFDELKLNPAELRKAAHALRVEKPVDVCIVSRGELTGGYSDPNDPKADKGIVLGQYVGEHDNRHHIHILDELRQDVASEALYHELTHAAQNERLGGFLAFRRKYRQAHQIGCIAKGCGCMRASCAHGYSANVLEHEALERAAELKRTGKLMPFTLGPVTGKSADELVRVYKRIMKGRLAQ